MSRHEEYENKTEKLLIPILDGMGFELWDVEYVKEGADYYLRAYIDKEGGITIDDCVDVSHALSDALDADDFIPDAYILEVSSPGLGRTLKKEKEFLKSIGKEVDVKTYKPVNGSKEFTGILESYDNGNIEIKADDEIFCFEKSDIAVVKLSIDF